MLSEILKRLKERGPMSLAEISRHFKSEISAMEGMLRTLEAKGRIEQLDTKCSRCKGCVEVKPEDAAIFQCLEATALHDSASSFAKATADRSRRKG